MTQFHCSVHRNTQFRVEVREGFTLQENLGAIQKPDMKYFYMDSFLCTVLVLSRLYFWKKKSQLG